VGDSITQQWGSPLLGTNLGKAWTNQFGKAKTVNIGTGEDKTQNILWRLDHGGVDGINPACIVLMIGNNNMFFVAETGIDPVARGIKACADNLRVKFPKTPIALVKILPAHEPGNPFYENIRKTNLALDSLKLESDKMIGVLDLTAFMTQKDGNLQKDFYSKDNIHLSESGYQMYAEKLRPFVDSLVSKNK
jgi:platelet-activating factor acetylhydrolase IB subunit beta/gamma